MAEVIEKRGPIEKTQKGWPINPLGVVVLGIFILVIVFLIVKPLLLSNISPVKPAVNGQIATPQAGQIVHGDKLRIELSLDDTKNVAKVEFWAKDYVENKWEVIGTVDSFPYALDWQIPASFQNKAIAITTHINLKSGSIINDPGGWREGIIVLNP